MVQNPSEMGGNLGHFPARCKGKRSMGKAAMRGKGVRIWYKPLIIRGKYLVRFLGTNFVTPEFGPSNPPPRTQWGALHRGRLVRTGTCTCGAKNAWASRADGVWRWPHGSSPLPTNRPETPPNLVRTTGVWPRCAGLDLDLCNPLVELGAWVPKGENGREGGGIGGVLNNPRQFTIHAVQ